MIRPNESVAAPGFRPVMPMNQVARPPMRPMTGSVMRPQQLGTNGFLGGTNFNAFRSGFNNGFAAGSGFNGFTVGGLAAFNRNNFLRGTAIQNASLGLGFSGVGFNGFASGLGAMPTSFGAAGFGATRSPATGFGFPNAGAPFINGFQNLNGFGAFSPFFNPASFNGASSASTASMDCEASTIEKRHFLGAEIL